MSVGTPDAKTRRYDRQLRLWAASGQAALESCRILVLGGSATCTSILKNLVLPGIGHFTILDSEAVTHQDAGNNFFLEGDASIGKSRAQEAVRLLCELNEAVDGSADTRNIEDVLASGKDGIDWIMSFTSIVAHNLDSTLLNKLSNLLWQTPNSPTLVVVKTAGFLAEFSLQFHEHAVIESHSETAPSLCIDSAFPDLKAHALSLNLDSMDQTEHAHIPYVVILVRGLEDWKSTHGGNPPSTYAEKKEFKSYIGSLKRKFDEENFEEAEAQAYRCWTSSRCPSEVIQLFSLPQVTSPTPPDPSQSSSATFFLLVRALKKFLQLHDDHLPLTSTLPDMKASTSTYIHLQKLYKNQAEKDKAELQSYLEAKVDQAIVDAFVKNCHAIAYIGGKRYGSFDDDRTAIANAVGTEPKALAIHIGFTALSSALTTHASITPSYLGECAKGYIPEGVILSDMEGWEEAAGELVRSPSADLPNTAAFMGGLVAQEMIKIITKQYMPLSAVPRVPTYGNSGVQDDGRTGGICVVDLVGSWTASI